MTGRRLARAMPWGQHVEDADHYIWVKFDDDRWIDGSDGAVCTNQQIDEMLARGAEAVSYGVDLDVDEVAAYDLDAGEYVVLPWGFWSSGDFIDDDQSQELWRVAAWTWHGPVTSTILLDAPEPRLARSNYFSTLAHFGPDDASWDRRAFEIYVDADTAVRVVLPGQDHETWDDEWDWSDEFKIVGTRAHERG